jgi:hypothetical protein
MVLPAQASQTGVVERVEHPFFGVHVVDFCRFGQYADGIANRTPGVRFQVLSATVAPLARTVKGVMGHRWPGCTTDITDLALF